jgi:hypothetical protein
MRLTAAPKNANAKIIQTTLDELKTRAASMASQLNNPSVAPAYNKLLGKIEALEAVLEFLQGSRTSMRFL